jgi:MFS family permease
MPSLLDRLRASKNTVVFVVTWSLFVDLLVYGCIIPVLPDYVETLGASTVEIGVLFASFSVGSLLSTPVFGILCDNPAIGRRKPALFGLLMLALCTLGFGVGRYYTVLLIARFLQGVASAAVWVSGMALLYDAFDPSEVGSKLGIAMTMNGLGYLVGPVIGGLLYTHVSYASIFEFCAFLVFLDFLGRFYLIPDAIIPITATEPISALQTAVQANELEPLPQNLLPDAPSRTSASSSTSNSIPISSTVLWDDLDELPHPDPYGTDDVAFSTYALAVPVAPVASTIAPASTAAASAEALGASVSADHEMDHSGVGTMWKLLKDPDLGTCFLSVLMASIIFSALEPLLPLHLARVLHSTPDEVGGIFFVCCILFVAMTGPAGVLSDTHDTRKLICTGLVLLSIFMPLSVLPRAVWLEIIVELPLGLGLALVMTPSSADCRQYLVSRGWMQCSAQCSALYGLSYSLGMALGPVVGAALDEWLGTCWAFLCLGCLGLASVPFVFRRRFFS